MRHWLIALLIIIIVALSVYEGVRYLDMRSNRFMFEEAIRPILDKELSPYKLRMALSPEATLIWPESETRIKEILIEKARELRIPVGEQDIALWHDESKVYCRVAWTQEIKILAYTVGSVLYDQTVEVSLR